MFGEVAGSGSVSAIRAPVDRNRPRSAGRFGSPVTDITRSVRDANAEVGARVLELAGRETSGSGPGYVKDLKGSRAEHGHGRRGRYAHPA